MDMGTLFGVVCDCGWKCDSLLMEGLRWSMNVVTWTSFE